MSGGPRAVEVEPGESPVVLGFPHTGTWLPETVAARLNERGRTLADTDWHVDRLYAGLLPGATRVRALFHRYLIDANRDPAGVSLYPGQSTTGLCPTTDFDGRPIWRDGEAPGVEEIEERRLAWHRVYHDALQGEIERVHARHGVVVLYDCHSIRSRIDYLFEGVLPDFNVGTNEGRTCAPEMESAVRAVCEAAKDYTHVVNGRFKGGWTTRRYGEPARARHALQMELAQSTYLASEALPFDYDPAKAERLRVHLGAVLQRLEQAALG